MARHYFMLLRVDTRMMIASFVLEDKGNESEYDSIAIELLLHHNSPFANDLLSLFSDLRVPGKGELSVCVITLAIGYWRE